SNSARETQTPIIRMADLPGEGKAGGMWNSLTPLPWRPQTWRGGMRFLQRLGGDFLFALVSSFLNRFLTRRRHHWGNGDGREPRPPSFTIAKASMRLIKVSAIPLILGAVCGLAGCGPSLNPSDEDVSDLVGEITVDGSSTV